MFFEKPLLSPYEFYCILGKAIFDPESYPMDYYSDKGGEWTNYYHKQKINKPDRKKKIELELEEPSS